MKNIIIILIALSWSIALIGQKGYGKRSTEKIDALRIAYITDNLNLTPEEAKEFWPVYNEFENKLEEHRESQWSLIEASDSVDESHAKEILAKSIALDESELNLKKTYMDRLSKIIGYRKVLKLKSLDRSFKKELLSKMKYRDR
jgi:hypothetical protein